MERGRVLRVAIRTPSETVFDENVSSLLVPTETGQVGLRPRCEATVLNVEAGLVLLRQGERERYAGTAGGILRVDGEKATLLTPMVVCGDEMHRVVADLERLLSEPSEEMEVRRSLGHLEQRILSEVRESDEASGRLS